MNPSTRSLIAIVFGIPALLVVPLALVGSRILAAGTLEVHVIEKGPAGGIVDVRVPAAIVPALAGASSVCSFGGHSFDPECRRALDVASSMMEILRDAPDGVYFDFRSRDEIVLVEKRDGTLTVDVDTPDEKVRATIPLGAVRSALGFL